MEDGIQELERRLARAEEALVQLARQTTGTRGAGTKLIAPVTVVNADGIPVLEISTIHDQNAGPVIRFSRTSWRNARRRWGRRIRSNLRQARNRVGYLNVEASGGRVLIEDHDREGGVVLFGGNDDGGGISILPKGEREGISLSSTSSGGQLRMYNNSVADPVILISASDTGGRVETLDVNKDGLV